MKSKVVFLMIVAVIMAFGAANVAYAKKSDAKKPDAIKEGKALFLSEKYKCFSCHGKDGEGAAGPSFKGVGKRFTTPELIKQAAHHCPPTKACSPKDMAALAEYLRTL